jgi:hypothetical protein
MKHDPWNEDFQLAEVKRGVHGALSIRVNYERACCFKLSTPHFGRLTRSRARLMRRGLALLD